MYSLRIALATAVVAFGTSSAPAQTTTRVSVATDGAQLDSSSLRPSISADGLVVAFESGTTTGRLGIIVHDRQMGQTSQVSNAADGGLANAESQQPSVSADGRFVAFRSGASNLIPGDSNGYIDDVFVRDRHAGLTSIVSVASGGVQGNADSYGPSISADGRFVAFPSQASNLVPGDTNLETDVFVHDRLTGQTSIVSISSSGALGNNQSSHPSISADGRFVAFQSFSSNLVSGDTNGWADVFIHDRQTGETSIVSVASNATQGNWVSYFPTITADGRFVAFPSAASNLVPDDANDNWDVFVHDRQTGETSIVSVATGGVRANSSSGFTSISSDGRFVAFESYASNLVYDDTNGWKDVFVHDRQTRKTSRASVATGGVQGDFISGTPSASADGRYVAFYSLNSNLVPGDTNRQSDIFVHDRCASVTCPGDADSDGAVVFADITEVLENLAMDFVPCTGPGDADHNGVVSISDIATVLENWGTTCP